MKQIGATILYIASIILVIILIIKLISGISFLTNDQFFSVFPAILLEITSIKNIAESLIYFVCINSIVVLIFSIINSFAFVAHNRFKSAFASIGLAIFISITPFLSIIVTIGHNNTSTSQAVTSAIVSMFIIAISFYYYRARLKSLKEVNKHNNLFNPDGANNAPPG